MSWDFPSVEPPPYLRRLSPALYREECERARARFTEAVQLAEQAFVEELAALVEHLNERLTGEDEDHAVVVIRRSPILRNSLAGSVGSTSAPVASWTSW